MKLGHCREVIAECAYVEAVEEYTYQEEQVGEACHDERFLRSGNRRVQRVIEADEQVRAYTHQLPEQVHLEYVRGNDKAKHRHGEKRQESVITLEALLAMHVAERIDMNHETDRGDDYEHHHRYRRKAEANGERQQFRELDPYKIKRRNGGEKAGGIPPVNQKILYGSVIAQHRHHSERACAYQSCDLVRHLHAGQAKHEERQSRQKEYQKYITIIHNTL